MQDSTTATIVILTALIIGLIIQELIDYRKRKCAANDDCIDLSGLPKKK